MKSTSIRVFVLAASLLGACSDPNPQATVEVATAPPKIYSVNYPLAWVAAMLVGEQAETVFPAPADGDPAFWQPTIDEIGQYQQADLILLNGASYARWIARTSLPASRMINTSAGFTDKIIYEDSGPVHSHGPEGAHSHGEAAFTIWLDPTLFAQQAQAVATAIKTLPPIRPDDIDTKLATLQQTLADWDSELAMLATALDDAPLLYSHPVYQYLQRRYALNGVALHWEPDQVPTEAQWRALEKLLHKHPADIMLWEEEPLPEVSAQLEKLGIKAIVFRPQGNRSSAGDYAEVMASNLENLRTATTPSSRLQ